MAHRYTEKQLEDAKAYLRERLEGEVSMENDVLDLLSRYAEMLVSLYMRPDFKQSDVELLVEDLIAQLLNDCETLAVDNHKDKKDDILAYIYREWNGENLKDRVRGRCGTFADEVAAVTLAGMILGRAKKAIVDSIKKNLVEPWKNAILVEARDKIHKGEIGVLGHGVKPEVFDERHYGRGVPVSSLIGLQRMTRFAVGEGWMYNDHQRAKDNGAIGFIPVRGSNVPCYICDEHAERFHYMREDAPQYHLSCLCSIVWIYSDKK